MDPTTQGSQAEANGSESQANETQQEMIPKARLDEVLAQQRENKETMAQLQATLLESQRTLQQVIADRQQGSQQSQEQMPEGLDESDVKKMDFFLKRAIAPLQQEISTLKRGLVSARSEPEVDWVQAQLAKMNDPIVTAKTNDMMEKLRRNGHLGTTYTPREVLKQVIGEVSLAKMLGGNQQNLDERNGFNGAPLQPLASGGAGGGPRRQAQAPRAAAKALDDKPLDEMSMEEMAQWIAQTEAKNPGGLPF